VVERAQRIMTATDRVSRFIGAAAEQSCTVHDAVDAADAAAFVAGRCAALDGLVAVSDTEPALSTRALTGALDALGVETLMPDAADWRNRIATASVGVTTATVAVADLGVVAVVVGPRRPRSVSLLPETHICVVAAVDVVEDLAQALARVAGAPLPSALLWIGGPSRTGDLEMITTLGVHGPRAVEIVVVNTTIASP
jgi:L-lactate dehydrogenase complex protein LldG